MEHIPEFFQTQSNWLLLISGIIAIFLLISLVKTLVKVAVVLVVASVAAMLLFDVAPEDLAEAGTTSLKSGSEFLQEKMIPLISEFYFGELFESEKDNRYKLYNILEEQ